MVVVVLTSRRYMSCQDSENGGPPIAVPPMCRWNTPVRQEENGQLQVHTVHVGSRGIRRRKPRQPLTDSPDDGAQMLVADTPNAYSTMTPYGAAMGMATFVGKLIRRVTGEERSG